MSSDHDAAIAAARWRYAAENPTSRVADKLRRLADALESGKRFEIQIAGEKILVLTRAINNIEHERDGIEFQIKRSKE